MKSMTGFGRSEITIGSQQIHFEIKSVNHRFIDFRVRLPSHLSHWETALCEQVRSVFERGSFDVFVRTKWNVTTQSVSGSTRFVVDQKALESFKSALSTLNENFPSSSPPQLSDVIRTGKIVIPLEDTENADLPIQSVLPAWKLALQELSEMRQAEGKKLKAVMEKVMVEMESRLNDLVSLVPKQREKIQQKWEARLSQWKIDPPLEAHRLEWELALLTEKSDITEEIDRFAIHISAARKAFQSASAVGRRLDFLIQEMHREVNTIASKAQLMEITQLTVELKSNIEKLREQVQNVE